MLHQTGLNQNNIDPIVFDPGRYDVFSFYRETHISNERTKAEMDSISSLIANFDASTHYTFDLSKFIYSRLDGRINGKTPKDGVGNLVYRLFKYIGMTEITYRILHKNYVVYVHITRPSVNVVSPNSNMTIIAINTTASAMIAHKVAIRKEAVDNKIELLRSSGSPYKAHLSHVIENRYDDFISYDYLLALVGESLINFIKDYRANMMGAHLEYQKSDVEIAFIEKCQQYYLAQGKVLSANIESMVSNYSMTERKSEYQRFIYGRVITDFDSERYDWTGYKRSPIIKFSNDYSDFITTYANSLGIFDPNARTDIMPYMMFPRFGYEASFQLENKKFVYTRYDIQGSRITICAQYYLNENVYISGTAVITNGYMFNVKKSISEVKLNINYVGVGEFTRVKFSDIVSTVPNELTSVDNLMQLIYDIISFQIAVHDCPGRKLIMREEAYRNTGKRSKANSGTGEHPVIICRLNVPYRVAKEYINCGYINETGFRAPPDYVQQHWSRKGHFRHYADGHVVEIPPCICTRRLPLTDKEVHIID